MYEVFFGLRDAPFGMTPNTDYFYAGSIYQEALNVVILALDMGEGFIKVTGEVGTGKTFLCRKVMNVLDRSGYVTAYLPNPFMQPHDLYKALAGELGIVYQPGMGFYSFLNAITRRLLELYHQGRKVALLMDEVQALPTPTLEAVRLLTNLETEQSKILQVVLFGQLELDERLATTPEIRQLRQRITFSYRLRPLTGAEVAEYVAKRLQAAGHRDGSLFSRRAVRLLHRYSGGIPRLVNILAHKALLSAFGQGVVAVEAAHVRLAARDTEGVVLRRGWWL